MSRNGSGTYTLPAGNPVVSGTTISSTWANTTLSDIASALTGSIASDGQTPMSAALNMTNNPITNVANPSNAQDAATKSYVDGLTGGFGSMATQNSNSVSITGGAIDGTAIGATTATTGKFTTATATTANITDVNASTFNTTNFHISESGGKLIFKYGTTTIASLDSSGNFTTLANVNAAGTP